MVKKITERKINNLLSKIWNGNFGAKIKYKDPIEKHLEKINSYKRNSSKIKYQEKVFGTFDGDVLTLNKIVNIINKVIEIKRKG